MIRILPGGGGYVVSKKAFESQKIWAVVQFVDLDSSPTHPNSQRARVGDPGYA
jgi:hypothetical protein